MTILEVIGVFFFKYSSTGVHLLLKELVRLEGLFLCQQSTIPERNEAQPDNTFDNTRTWHFASSAGISSCFLGNYTISTGSNTSGRRPRASVVLFVHQDRSPIAINYYQSP